MKNIFFYIFTIAVSSMTAQTIMSLEQYPNGGQLSGIYFKDLNGLLDAYTGTWQWSQNNLKLTFYLYKDEEVTFSNPLRGIFQQDVVFGYYVYKEDGNVLIDTKPILLSRIDSRDWVKRGGVGLKPTSNGYNTNDLPLFRYADYSRTICLNGEQVPFTGSRGFWGFVDPSTAKISLATWGTIASTCGFTELHPNFPSNETITITKISNTAPPLD